MLFLQLHTVFGPMNANVLKWIFIYIQNVAILKQHISYVNTKHLSVDIYTYYLDNSVLMIIWIILHHSKTGYIAKKVHVNCNYTELLAYCYFYEL